MKLSKEALLEIVAIFQDGILENKDMSDGLRELDLIVREGSADDLTLSQAYLSSHPRADVWVQSGEPN